MVGSTVYSIQHSAFSISTLTSVFEHAAKQISEAKSWFVALLSQTGEQQGFSQAGIEVAFDTLMIFGTVPRILLNNKKHVQIDRH
mmetsp:Transcript_10323/g.27066  ORF Transcript_10323/g.27066 Transcript_10323/m.27066 type:complete len:85 (-) Transcript_10323:1162-1416(-)